jgi:hypothetical protein
MSDDRKPNQSDPSVNTAMSRRNFLSGACSGAAVVGGGIASLAMTGDAQAQYWDYYGGNVWKSTARYQYYPNGPARCAGCVNFRPYAACAVVEPPISPDGWCRYFSPIPVVYAPPEYPEPYNPPAYPQPYYQQPYYPRPYYQRPWVRPYGY